MNKKILIAVVLAGVCAARVRAQASAALVSGGVKYPVPSQTRDSVDARKAGLASLKIGVGQFQHLYTVKMSEIGMPAYKPVGPAETWDFEKKIPVGWEKGSHNGAFFLNHDRPNTDGFILLPGSHEDYTAEVTARWVSGEETYAFGFIVNQSKAGSYTLGISHNNGVLVWRNVNNQGTALFGWQTLPNVVNAAGDNVLRVERHGDKLSFSVNGHEVYSGVDNSLEDGQIGLYLGHPMVAAFSHLSIQETEADDTAQTTLGSGYDYADEFMDGMVHSGLFKPDQLGPSNFPKGETWDYVIENPTLSTAARDGVKVVVKKRDTGDVILEQNLPLPASWDQRQYAQLDTGLTERDAVMKRLGEYTAYLLADKLLPAAAPEPKK